MFLPVVRVTLFQSSERIAKYASLVFSGFLTFPVKKLVFCCRFSHFSRTCRYSNSTTCSLVESLMKKQLVEM